METILITGGTGFLGSSLLRRLTSEGYRLILLARKRSVLEGDGLEKLLAEEGTGAQVPLVNIEVVEGDITSPNLGLDNTEFLALASDVDTVFHCAALTDFRDRDALVQTNVMGTKHVLDFAVTQRPKRYHHISSAYVVGKHAPNGEEGSTPDSLKFNNAYEETKYLGELLVKRYVALFQLSATIYRPSIIVGDSRFGYTKAFKGMYSFAKALYLISRYACGKPFRIFGDREAAINLVPVDYVADGIASIAADKRSINKTFHITNPEPPTLSQLNILIANALDIRPPEIVPLTDQPPLNSLERLYLSYTRPYLPYVQSRIHFDSTSTQELLADAGVVCPRITQKLVSLLIRFAIENNWGSRTERQEPILAGVN